MAAELYHYPGPFSPSPPAAGGNGGNSDDRLRALEIQVARIDERIKTTATKVWVLSSIGITLVNSIGIALALIKLFD